MKIPVPVDRAHGGAVAEGVIDFSISVNPLGPPPAAVEAYHSAVSRITSYPAPKSLDLEERLAAWLGVGPENVLAANGTTQLIYLLARVLEPGRPFVVIPTFSEIANALAGEGLPPEPIQLMPERDYRIDFDQIDEVVNGHASAIFIGRPNSPTGTMITLAEVESIASRCADRGCWCVLDEAFIDFVDPPESVVQLVQENPRLIVLRSLTKSFAIPGLRLGCAIASDDVTAAVHDAIEPWSVNVVAEEVGIACLRVADEYLQHSRDLVTQERAYLSDALTGLGLKVFPSVANFLMLKVMGESSPGEFGELLLKRGVAVRDLRGLPGCADGLYRVGIRDHADNERLVAAVRELKYAK